MAGTTYRIRVVKPDFEFEAEGDKAFVLNMLAKFHSHASIPSTTKKTPPKQSTPAGSEVSHGKKPLSVGEFILQLGTKKHTETVLAFGYYLEKYGGLGEFTVADINSCYYDSKMEASNTSQMITVNVRSSRIMPAKKKKGEKGHRAYVLTRTGEKFIEKKLSSPKQ